MIMFFVSIMNFHNKKHNYLGAKGYWNFGTSQCIYEKCMKSNNIKINLSKQTKTMLKTMTNFSSYNGLSNAITMQIKTLLLFS